MSTIIQDPLTLGVEPNSLIILEYLARKMGYGDKVDEVYKWYDISIIYELNPTEYAGFGDKLSRILFEGDW
jgi:hypothetical protein